MEIGAWKEIFSTPMAGEPAAFSFFRGGEGLYGVTEPHSLGRKLADRIALVIDLRTGGIERLPSPVTAETAYYTALSGRTLIGVRGNRELVRTEWPDLRELASATVNGPINGGLNLTGDRQRLIHVVDQSLVCRRTEDFRVLWSRQIDASIDLAATLNGRGVLGPSLSIAYNCLSADGSTAAIGARRVNNIAAPVEFYIEILDGKDGTPVARWPKNPDQGIALSADGSLLAVAELVETGNDLQPTIRVHEVPSGKEVATVVHDQIALNRRLGGTVRAGEFGFTSDSKYLVTANDYKLKIWELQRE
jgi:hypothetical protein